MEPTGLSGTVGKLFVAQKIVGLAEMHSSLGKNIEFNFGDTNMDSVVQL